VAQRAVIVLPSTGAFDSRTWRIASSLAQRGHQVTVLARAGSGLPDDETGPLGYAIRRVPVDAVDGLPGPLRSIARAIRSRRGASDATSAAGSPVAPAADGAVGSDPRPAPGRRSVLSPLRRLINAGWRLVALGLTIRAQRIATARTAPHADLVHAMAYMGIPVGLALGRRDGTPVIYDARDIYVDARNIARMPRPLRWLFGRIERRWAQAAARVITVNDPYAEVMETRFGTPRPLVVMNASVRREWPAARPRRFHETLRLPADRRVVLYHGGLSPERGIEQLVRAIPDVPNATLVLMGYGDLEPWLRGEGTIMAGADRIAILPAVPPSDLIDWVASADVAAMPIQPTTLNHRLTTPNKLLEAIAAGVPVVASDLPGMAPIVRAYGCGVLVDPTDPAAIAAAIRAVLDASPEQNASFQAGLARARDELHWDRQMEKLLDLYGQLTGRPW
jgi:glycosyltransferase involved in cell wall biosynthesis